jgi:hypothetical protein
MSATTSAHPSFGDRVRDTMESLPTSTVIDRFAANDVLLDLLEAAGPAEEARVLAALASLPKSGLIDRSALNTILLELCQSSN